jgi:uncharacterized protein (TIGR00255 family)
MIKSMTGFGRSKGKMSKGRLIIEIQSVNKKNFETSIYLPKELFRYEIDIKKRLSKRLHRGHVILRCFLSPEKENLSLCLPDVDLLSALKNEWIKIAEKTGFDTNQIDINFITQQSRVLQGFIEETIVDEEVFFEIIDEAIDSILVMKKQEGENLFKDIYKRLELIKGYLKKIQELSPKVVEAYKNKLEKRISELFPLSENKDIISREVVVYAEKSDITEEIIRLFSHLEQFNDAIDQSLDSVGRRLDFLLQEMNRETNTISSKSQDIDISKLSISIKSELDKIREQVQNIE